MNELGENQKAVLDQLTKATKDAAADTRGEIEKLVQRTSDALKEIQTSTDSKLEALRKTSVPVAHASANRMTRSSVRSFSVIRPRGTV